MNKTLLGMATVVVLMGATAAHAQDCGPQPNYAPMGQSFQTGHYELQSVQQWVPGGQQQVWVNGTCDDRGRGRGRGRWGRGGGRGGGWNQQCTQGYYRTVYSAGHYVTQQQWVWVAYRSPPPAPPRPQYGYGPRGGVTFQGRNGHVAVSVY